MKRRSLLVLVLGLALGWLSGCGPAPSEQAPGLWSHGASGRLLDVTPHGFYAEVWVDSEASVAFWEIARGPRFVLVPLCSLWPEGERREPFSFVDDGLTFPGEEKGRYLRYIREVGQHLTDPRLVGLWQHETKNRRYEYLEFTPWGTAVWNRWQGEAGQQTLRGGWSAIFPGAKGGLLFRGVEEKTLLPAIAEVPYSVSANSLSLGEEGSRKEFVKVSREELRKASLAPTR